MAGNLLCLLSGLFGHAEQIEFLVLQRFGLQDLFFKHADLLSQHLDVGGEALNFVVTARLQCFITVVRPILTSLSDRR